MFLRLWFATNGFSWRAPLHAYSDLFEKWIGLRDKWRIQIRSATFSEEEKSLFKKIAFFPINFKMTILTTDDIQFFCSQKATILAILTLNFLANFCLKK